MSWSGRGDRSVFAAVVTFVGGLGSQAGEGDVISLLPRDHAERWACMRGRGAHTMAGVLVRDRARQRPTEMGALWGWGPWRTG